MIEEPVVAPQVVVHPEPPQNLRVIQPAVSFVLEPASTPTPQRITTKYRFAENPADLEKAAWVDYTLGGVTVTHTFLSSDLGPKFIYAQFQDNQGVTFNAQPYPYEIELTSIE